MSLSNRLGEAVLRQFRDVPRRPKNQLVHKRPLESSRAGRWSKAAGKIQVRYIVEDGYLVDVIFAVARRQHPVDPTVDAELVVESLLLQ
jgi:hypothetical protein